MENFHGIVVCGKDGDVQRAFGTIWKWDSISEASARHDLWNSAKVRPHSPGTWRTLG